MNNHGIINFMKFQTFQSAYESIISYNQNRAKSTNQNNTLKTEISVLFLKTGRNLVKPNILVNHSVF